MSTQYVVTSKLNPARFLDKVSKGDAVTYSFDFSPWQEDNHTIVGTPVWTVESGYASVSGQAIVAGVTTALVTFNQAGRSIISILASTTTEKKKIWLEVYAEDQFLALDDYGLMNNA